MTSEKLAPKPAPSSLDFRTMDPPERKRTYHFGDGDTVVLSNVSRIAISPSGNHRLEADGELWIVPPTWIAIQIDDDKWDF